MLRNKCMNPKGLQIMNLYNDNKQVMAMWSPHSGQSRGIRVKMTYLKYMKFIYIYSRIVKCKHTALCDTRLKIGMNIP